MREAFYAETSRLLDEDPRLALVLADISAAGLLPTARRHPDRVINVGIREQLMVSVAGGLALTGLRPIAHSYAPFLIERAWEQVKLDLTHQGVGAILVSVGSSYDASESGRTHHSPGDVALLDTLEGWTVRIPGHPAEVSSALRAAAADDGCVYVRLASRGNRRAYARDGQLAVLRRGEAGLVVTIGPMLEPVLAATDGLGVTVAYTDTPRPLDVAGLRELAGQQPAAGWGAAVVMVEPYLAGTSAHAVSTALAGTPHRLLSLGVGRTDLHRYGTPADHDAAHGLHPAGLRSAIAAHAGIA